MNEKDNDQEKIRFEKLQKLIKKGDNPFLEDNFKQNSNISSIKKEYLKYSKLELINFQNKTFSLAGRIIRIRNAGKICFANIRNNLEDIQIYLKKEQLKDKYIDFINLDIGDIIGFNGYLIKTNTGELTIFVKKFVLLSKSLKPLPDIHYGFSNIEDRYRNRYLDLIINKDVKKNFILRTKIIRQIQKYLDNLGYLEVETPILQQIHGGAAAKPFKTFHNSLNNNFYLRIATELHLKRLIIGGFNKVYEIGRIFRNEGIDRKHNPEFTTLEIYTAYDNMFQTMNLCENIIKNSALIVNEKLLFNYDNFDIDLNKPFKKVKMVDAIKEKINLDVSLIKDLQEMIKIANKYNIKIKQSEKTKGHIINLLFENLVEPNIKEPTFIYEYPIEISPLSKSNKDNKNFTDRFELFILGREYANAFSELNNPLEQKERFLNQLEEKELGNEEANEMDHDFIEALKYGLPPTGGLGIGIDRLIMFFLNLNSIKDVILFPTLKFK